MKILTRGFRAIEVIDLSDLTKGSVAVEQVTELNHDGDWENIERYYEDSVVPSRVVNNKLSGNITIKGDIEGYVFSLFDGGSKTNRLFELGHYYLVRALGVNVDSEVAEMVYLRWTGQLVSLPKQSRKASELTEQEVQIKVATYGTIGFEGDEPYEATSGPIVGSGSPTPGDPDPVAAYDPLFTCRVPDTTKTLVAAETEVGDIVNPV